MRSMFDLLLLGESGRAGGVGGLWIYLFLLAAVVDYKLVDSASD